MNKETRREVVEKLFGLMTAAFGLVAALAWNDAIQSLFKLVFGEQSSAIAKFVYAAGITVLVVIVTIQVGRVQGALRGPDNTADKK